jgi:hypothetical protein
MLLTHLGSHSIPPDPSPTHGGFQSRAAVWTRRRVCQFVMWTSLSGDIMEHEQPESCNLLPASDQTSVSSTGSQRRDDRHVSGIQFIHFQPLADDSTNFDPSRSPHSQRTIHSHAARVIHARRRQSRTLAYQSARGRGVGQMPRELPGCPRVGMFTHPQGYNNTSPPVVVDAYRRGDPFNSFARPLSSTEHLLLDHCQFPLQLLHFPLFALADPRNKTSHTSSL